MGLLLQTSIFLLICCLSAANDVSPTVEKAIGHKNSQYELYFNKGQMISLVEKLFVEKLKLLVLPLYDKDCWSGNKEDAIKKFRKMKASGIKHLKINTKIISKSPYHDLQTREIGEMVFTYKGAKGEKTVKYEREWVYVSPQQGYRIDSEMIVFN